MERPLLSVSRDAELFVVSIREPSNNDLRVILVEGRAQDTPVSSEFGPAFPEPDDTCRAFEMTWRGYVGYSVRNDSYWKLARLADLDGPGRKCPEILGNCFRGRKRAQPHSSGRT